MLSTKYGTKEMNEAKLLNVINKTVYINKYYSYFWDTKNKRYIIGFNKVERIIKSKNQQDEHFIFKWKYPKTEVTKIL